MAINGVSSAGIAASMPGMTTPGTGKAGGAKSADVYQQLDEYVKMTPAQRMRADLLRKLGLSEEELAAKPPEERAALDARLRDLVRQQMEQAGKGQQAGPKRPGQYIDTTA